MHLIRVSDETVYRRLQELAKAEDRSLQSYVTRLLRAHVDEPQSTPSTAKRLGISKAQSAR